MISLRIFLDARVMEVFANDGATASYAVIDAKPQDLGIEVFAMGGTAHLDSLTAWPMKPASFSLDHYKI
jgi:fructan beta-fructosidase